MDYIKKFKEANKQFEAKPKGFTGLLFSLVVAIVVFVIIMAILPTAVTSAGTNTGDETVNTLSKLVPLILIAGVLVAYLLGLFGKSSQ